AILTSAHIADMSVAIPLLRNISDLGVINVHALFDKGYDAQAIYQEAHSLKLEPIIPLKTNSRSGGEWTDDSAPTCLREHGYSYDSFDKRYCALKFIQPLQKCRECPLFHEKICQKVIKIKQSSDIRKFNHPARGTKAWEKLYAKRSAVERVNGYLKEHMKLNDTTHYRSEIVQVELLLIQLAYNLKNFAAQRLSQVKYRKELVA
ncbi:transposase, partial [Vagococcus silagei]